VSAPTLSPTTAAPGFYGKLPARGDFIGRRLSRRFIDAWDAWLQESIHASRMALGDAWLGLYLNGPIWRFALSPGACGPEAAAGVAIPSVDSVGRYFPLMLGSELGTGTDLAQLAAGSGDWHSAIEARILATLDDGFALEALDAALNERPAISPAASAGTEALPRPGWRFAPEPDGAIPPAALDLLRRARHPATVWWTDGSEQVAPTCLICSGLPAPGSFASMLDGDWAGRGWTMAASEPQEEKE
jgi:type VI secretion system protein ImpM